MRPVQCRSLLDSNLTLGKSLHEVAGLPYAVAIKEIDNVTLDLVRGQQLVSVASVLKRTSAPTNPTRAMIALDFQPLLIPSHARFSVALDFLFQMDDVLRHLEQVGTGLQSIQHDADVLRAHCRSILPRVTTCAQGSAFPKGASKLPG